MIFAILFLLLIHVVAAMIPMGICALLARSDARHGTHRLVRRSLTVSSMLTLAVFLFILMAFSVMVTRTAVVEINWIGIIAIHASVFIASMSFGSLGYFISYRIFRSSIPEGQYGGNEEARRLDESGNPYQPPSI